MSELEELKAKIVSCMDELQFLDFLGLDISDLVEVFEERIDEQREEFERATN